LLFLRQIQHEEQVIGAARMSAKLGHLRLTSQSILVEMAFGRALPAMQAAS
jgi:hypothetical protein